jgi:hypothetical protein
LIGEDIPYQQAALPLRLVEWHAASEAGKEVNYHGIILSEFHYALTLYLMAH